MKLNANDSLELRGTVVAVQANFYRVKLDPRSPLIQALLAQKHLPQIESVLNGQQHSLQLLCTKRALLTKLGQTVMVGDRVLVEDPDWSGERGAIYQVMPRQTELARPPIANADQILLLFSLAQPDLDPFQLTKFLLTAESTQMQVTLGLSKADLVDPKIQQYWCDRLSNWGYQAIPISLVTQQGIVQLKDKLQQKLTVLSGPSGVGKSSLLNHLNPNLNVRVGAVSERWHQGRHTTRHVELYDLDGQGYLADSPGFNQPDLALAPGSLASLFPEIREVLTQGSCQFSNCLHKDEPNCAVPPNWDRREYYLQLLEEITQKYAQNQQKAKISVHQKSKSGHAGEVTYEPLLKAKKYRRQSRRQQHQRLEDYYNEELTGRSLE